MKGNLSWSKAGTFVQITTDDDVVIARGWLYPEPPNEQNPAIERI